MESSVEIILSLVTGLTLGLVLGSFATMLSYRVPKGMSIVLPRSHCPLCQHVLGPRDLIPVFSWVLTKGRCNHCGAKISIRYPLIELATALLETLAFLSLGFSFPFLFATLIIIAFICWITFLIER